MGTAASSVGRQMLEAIKSHFERDASDLKVSLASWEARSPADQAAHLSRAVERVLRLPTTIDVAGLFVLAAALDAMPDKPDAGTRRLIASHGDY